MPATLFDLSEGGLSVRLTEEQELEQGTPTVVILALPRGERLMIESIVWHSRRLKPVRSEKAAFLVVAVLSNPSEAYLKLVAKHDKVRPPPPQPAVAALAPALTPAPSSTAAPAADPIPTAGSVWRVRLQLSGSPRSRTILVTTENTENAAARALNEAGAGWIVLEVTEV